jgi:hypothetical protein
VDSLWVSNTLVPSLIAAAVLLLILWPTRHSGTRMLRRWGVVEPTGPQSAEAVRYLRQRRILYVALFLVAPAVAVLIWPPVDHDETPGNILVPLLAAMLIAELVAALRPASGVRVASLDRRTWRDLVPWWAIAVTGVLVAWAGTLVALGFAAQPWADRYAAADPAADNRALLLDPTGWRTLGGLAVCLAVVAVIVFLAVRRPSVADAQVDAALRTRTARVAVGIGFLWLAGLVNDAQSRLVSLEIAGVGAHRSLPQPPGWLSGNLQQTVEIAGFVTLVGAILCWGWLAVPTRRSPVAPVRAG